MNRLNRILVLICTITLPALSAEWVYPNGAKKAVIFSYDDAPVQDKRLVALFNQYRVIGTFNVNSGLLGEDAPWMEQFLGHAGQYLTLNEIRTVYQGHEIAGHSYSHPALTGLDSQELERQLLLDQQILAASKHHNVRSFAYPLGAFDKTAMAAVAKAGFSNARTVKDTHSFSLPTQLMAWHPTAHHSRAMPLVNQYLELQPNELTLMCIWGHSWEFDQNQPNNNWQYIEQLVRKISNQEDIWYVSAGDFIEFITQHQRNNVSANQ